MMEKIGFSILVFTTFCSSATAFASPNLKSKVLERSLPKTLSEKLCAGSFDALSFWGEGIFDAQIEGAQLEVESSDPLQSSKQNLSDKRLKEEAYSLANEKGYQSYAFGRCSPRSGWVLAFPAREVLARSSSFLEVKQEFGCSVPLSAYLVQKDGGRSTPMKRVGRRFEIPSDVDGYVSVECEGKGNTSFQVSHEFYLLPIRKKKSDDFVLEFARQDVLMSMKRFDAVNKVISWINAVRVDEKLPELKRNEVLDAAAKKLLETGAVRHDERRLLDAAAELASKGIVLRGEDRVRGKSIEEALFLLWASPRHRDLILTSDPLVGVELIEVGNQVLLSIVTGLQSQNQK